MASYLLPKAIRPAILAFYDMARGGDAIADNPALSAEEKTARLQSIWQQTEQQQNYPLWAANYVILCRQMPEASAYMQLLWQAFRQDAKGASYDQWADLFAYCRLSANPVGRFMLACFKEAQANMDASDALCTLLQLLNHWQDSVTDNVLLERCYWPAQCLSAYGVQETDLHIARLSPAMIAFFSELSEQCQSLLLAARPLAPSIQQRRLRIEVRFIWHSARLLLHRLSSATSLEPRVTLSMGDKIAALYHSLKEEARR